MSVDRPRICHVITGLMTGGAERALLNLLHSGLTQRYDTTVISVLGDGPMVEPIRATGARVMFLNLSDAWRAPLALITLRRIARDIRPDIVQGWMYHGNLAATLMRAVSPGTPRLAWNIRQSLDYDLSREKTLTRKMIQLNSLLSRQPEAILYNADSSRKTHENFGFASTSAQVIPNGFNTGKMLLNEQTRGRVRAEFGFKNTDFVFLHAARLHPMKDHGTMLRAAVKCLESCPNARFVLAGLGVKKNLKEFLDNVPPDLRTKFFLLGERRDVPALIQGADCMVLSSFSEGFPNVLGESMAYNTPAITTDAGDSASVVGEAGVVVPVGDPSALAAAMTAMATAPASAVKLGHAGRKRVVAMYDISRAVEAYDALYQRLLAS